MNAKTKLPKFLDKEASGLSEAVHNAFSNPAADEFFEEVREAARKAQERRATEDEQTRVE